MSANIEIIGVSKVFGALTVLDKLSLSIKPNEFIVFLGPSGCGKSTLLRLIAGLDQADADEIHMNGERIDLCLRVNAMWPWCFKTMRFTHICRPKRICPSG